MASQSAPDNDQLEPGQVESGQVEAVSNSELNSWRRGLTPQAEIWNGRLAMVGLSVGLVVVLIVRLVSGGLS
ncbi:MAG: high light inducible protein [Synechococcus sp.]